MNEYLCTASQLGTLAGVSFGLGLIVGGAVASLTVYRGAMAKLREFSEEAKGVIRRQRDAYEEALRGR